MPIFELEESTYSGPIPDDTVLTAEVTSVGIRKKKAQSTGEEYERVNFKFTINDPASQWDGQNVYGDTSTVFNTHPDNRLRSWAREIMAVDEFPAKFRLNTDLLVGLECRVVVGAREYEKDGEQKVANFVKDVMRSRRAPAGRPALDEEPF